MTAEMTHPYKRFYKYSFAAFFNNFGDDYTYNWDYTGTDVEFFVVDECLGANWDRELLLYEE